MQSARGHSSLIGAADVIIEITNDDGLLTIRCEKQKDEEAFEVYYLRPVKVALPGDEDSLVLLPAHRVAVEFAPLTPHQRKVLETLNLEIFRDTGVKYGQLRTASGVPEGSIYRTLENLKKKGMISQGKSGEPYFITDVGRWAIEPSQGQNSVNNWMGVNKPSEPSQPSPSHQGGDDGSPAPLRHQPSSPSSPFRVMASDGARQVDKEAGNGTGRKVWKNAEPDIPN
jgi:hypothetical protein